MHKLEYGVEFWSTVFWIAAIGYLSIVSQIAFPLTSVLKPLPIICLIFMTTRGSLDWTRKVLLTAALLLSSIGDILLTLPVVDQLVLGLGAFLFAHLIYIRLFTLKIRLTQAKVCLCLLLLCCSASFLWFMLPHLGPLKSAVMVYVMVISLMGMSAIVGEAHTRLTVLGALLFMGSDAMIALNHFLYPQLNFTLPIMLAYYTAQFLIVSGTVGAKVRY